MRPLKLTMVAFGAYRDAELIDFTALGDYKLFAVSGNTGAGKTTIFDAICFALYGSASGEDRADFRMLRSQFADEDTHTSVELEFAAGARRYRVFRQMKHRKGENKSETGDKHELYEWKEERFEPATDRFTATEVNAKLYEIIGLTREQFIQIVMLPQGEFRKLLTSDTDNKEEILRKLFQTELYERLEMKFQAEHRKLSEELKSYKSELNALVKQAQQTMPKREEMDALLSEAADEEGQQAQEYRSEAAVAALQKEAAFYSAEEQAAIKQKVFYSEQINRLKTELQLARQHNAKHDELALKRKQLQELELQKEKMALMEKELAQARKAAVIAPYREIAVQKQLDVKGKKEQLLRKELDQTAAEEAARKADEVYQAELAREGYRKELEQKLHKLREMIPLAESLNEQRQQIEKLQNDKGSASLMQVKAFDQYQLQIEEKTKLREQIVQIESETDQLPIVRLKLQHIEQLGKQVTKLLQLTEERSELLCLEQARKRQRTEMRNSFEQLEQQWIDAQAATLAAHLIDGEPCPVCGSTDHPEKQQSVINTISRDQFEHARQELRLVEEQLSVATAQAAVIMESEQQAIIDFKGSIQQLFTAVEEAAVGWNEAGQVPYALGEFANMEQLLEVCELMLSHSTDKENKSKQQEQWKQKLQSIQLQLRTEWSLLRAHSSKLEQSRAQLNDVRKQEAEVNDQLVSLDKLKTEQQEKLTAIEIDLAGKTALYERTLQTLPDELRSLPKLMTTLQEKETQLDLLNKQWKQVQQAQQQTSRLLAEAVVYAKQANEQYEEAVQQVHASVAKFEEQLQLSGFASEAIYLQAVRTAEQEQGIAAELERYNRTLLFVKEQLLELERELANKERLPLEELDKNIARAEEQFEWFVTKEKEAAVYKKEAVRLAGAISRLQEQMKMQENTLVETADLYMMLKGDNTLKISFERYILIEYLEQILFMANERLQELSNGQFELIRSGRLEARGKQSGLGLDVYDAYTGQNRDVRSLSGGEKFNASLSLALGMADVIQANQGGVAIEMMLIDEGFGSLDEEALQKAIRTLVDLQQAGRMIGVISHVQEVKDAFPACIEVYKSKEGFSKTRLVLK